MAKKLSWYRLHTGLPGMQIFLPHESTAWQDIIKKYKDGKLGVTIDGKPKTPEMLHTEDMLMETWVDETDEEGIFDTEDKELAKYVLVHTKPFSGLPVGHEKNPDIAIPHYMAYFRKILDKGSPDDILAELEQEMKDKASPQARHSALAKAREAKLKS